jgi:hypothetical protein
MLLKKLIVSAGLVGTLAAAAPAIACEHDEVIVTPPAPAYNGGAYYGVGYGGYYGQPGVYYRDPWAWRRHEWERHRESEWRHRWHRW